MLTLTGQIINVFQNPEGTNKDGEKYGGQDRVQVMAENILKNGEKRVELVNLTVESTRPYEDLTGERVCIPVGAFCSNKAIQYFVIKGAIPSLAASC